MAKGNRNKKSQRRQDVLPETTSPEQLLLTDLETQHVYVESLKSQGDRGFALIAAAAFVKGMRDSGYRSTATAIDELVDNAYQSQADRVDLLCTTDRGKAVGDIFVVDNGHGMEPEMIRAAVLWGGTHRFNDRNGFGRYGFGLPSAAVSMTEHYAVYSKIASGQWHKVEINLLDVATGKLTNSDGLIVAPTPEPAELPAYVSAYLGDRVPEAGTVIHLIESDRLTSGFRLVQSFEQKMLEHLGVIYRGLLRNCSIYVNNRAVEVVDPLFIDPNARYYDIETGIRAQALPTTEFSVRTANGTAEGVVRLRFSYMHPNFQHDADGKRHNGRFGVMKENNAYLIVTRAGRQVDLVSRPQYAKESDNTTIVNFDRNWAIELDFDPVLDEEFGITVNKQQVALSEAIWQKLSDVKIPNVVTELRRKFKADRNALKNPDGGDVPVQRTSERVMQEASKFTTRSQRQGSEEQQQEAREKVQKEAEQRAEEFDTNPEEELTQIIAEQRKRPFAVGFEGLEGAPFYRTEQYGVQVRIWINRAHRFYQDFYSQFGDDPRSQTIIELLLFVLGECELEARGDRSLFYRSERAEWSKRLDIALALFDRNDSVDDLESALAEESEGAHEDN
jgi:hypothetical protein